MATNVLAYVPTAKPKEVAEYKPGTYTSKYQPQIDQALNTVTNWSYNPLQDASYQALAKIYGARGNTAAKNSLADAAALNGGYGTSYAVSAAQQARNQYNQELASLIPDLEANAYNKATTLGALRDADNTDYGRFRDTEQDRQWQYSQNYQKYRDLMSDYQWGQNYNLDIYGLRKAAASGGGGGGRRSGGGGGGGYYSSGGGGGLTPTYGVTQAASGAASGVASVLSTLKNETSKNFLNYVKTGASLQSKKTASANAATANAKKAGAKTK